MFIYSYFEIVKNIHFSFSSFFLQYYTFWIELFHRLIRTNTVPSNFILISFSSICFTYNLFSSQFHNSVQFSSETLCICGIAAIDQLPLMNVPDVIGLNGSAQIAYNEQYIDHIWNRVSHCRTFSQGLVCFFGLISTMNIYISMNKWHVFMRGKMQTKMCESDEPFGRLVIMVTSNCFHSYVPLLNKCNSLFK